MKGGDTVNQFKPIQGEGGHMRDGAGGERGLQKSL